MNLDSATNAVLTFLSGDSKDQELALEGFDFLLQALIDYRIRIEQLSATPLVVPKPPQPVLSATNIKLQHELNELLTREVQLRHQLRSLMT